MSDALRRAVDALDRAARAARAEGRDALHEHEGLAALSALGIAVPEHRFLRDVAEARALDLDRFPGDRVVVKVVSPEILHKSDVGGVAIVPRTSHDVAAAIEQMARAVRGREVAGFLVCAFVPHGEALGRELLIGIRDTAEFGPVVSVGAGGVHAEFLARQFRDGAAVAILSPAATPQDRAMGAVRRAAVASLVLDPQRGRPPLVAEDRLAAVVHAFLALARDAVPGIVRELEVNPLAIADSGPVALDVLAKVGTTRPAAEPRRPVAKLARLLEPRTIAIVGVSARMNPGRIILRNILRAGFPPERIAVIKPGTDTIDGCRCVADLAALADPVDLLIVAVDAAQVPAVVEDVCARKAAESVILIPGGLGETAGTADRAERIRTTLRAARATAWGGPVVNGGNCLGVRSLAGRYDTLFIPDYKLTPPAGPPAPLAILSQSGAFGIAQASQLDPLNPRILATLGNQTDLTIGDWLEHLAGDGSIRVFACYVEGFRPGDGARWLAAARAIVVQGRSVILYLSGRTPAGAQASASHTASVAGDYEVARQLAEHAGVAVAGTLSEFRDLTRLAVALDGRPLSGRRLAAVTNAGFESVAIADNLGPFTPATFSEATAARLQRALTDGGVGDLVTVRNPLDVTPILDDAGFAETAAAVLDDPGVDVAVVGCVPFTARLHTLPRGAGHEEDLERPDGVASRLIALWRSSVKPWVVVVDAGRAYDPLAGRLEAAGLAVFRNADRALRVLAIRAATTSR